MGILWKPTIYHNNVMVLYYMKLQFTYFVACIQDNTIGWAN